ncbi:MAG: IS21 family transposase [Anaerolineae bacterium]|nr:IS21 family transposase [Anaerolineae bacterium]
MIKVDKIEQIRRAYYVEGKSMRQIEREYHHSYRTIKKALERAEAGSYTLKEPREAPVLGPYQARIKELLVENDKLPGKHRLTGHGIYKQVWEAGYRGSESGVLHYLWQLRKAKRAVKVFIPLEFEPGQDAQVDWGEAEVILAGKQVTVQVFIMRLCYSRKLFVMAFPSQKQECFWAGHMAAFHFLGGIPHRLTYDNLKTAVKRIFIGSERQEQESFILFRSHYLFESHYCNPGAGHEKGRVEDGVGYVRRNFMTPLLKVADFADLNEQLQQACLADDQRRVDRQTQTIAATWQQEQSYLRPLPAHDLECCRETEARLNGFSQVEIETNRYSVPANRVAADLRVKLYPFEVKIYRLDEKEPIAVHPRCYGQQQDILEPLHYLPLLAQRPGAFHHAKPVRQWRATWPAVYERLLAELQQRQPGGPGLRQFIRVLQLHQHYPAHLIEQAVKLALQYHCPHADGVELCLRQLLQPEPIPVSLDLSQQPTLQGVGQQPISLLSYNQLLTGGRHGG